MFLYIIKLVIMKKYPHQYLISMVKSQISMIFISFFTKITIHLKGNEIAYTKYITNLLLYKNIITY
jgi:hypothetical protein